MQINRILLIRLKAIGDIILTTPVIKKLKKYFPTAKIDIIVYKGGEQILENNPYLNKIYVIERKNFSKIFLYLTFLFKRYDVSIDFICNPTSALITLFAGARIRIGRKSRGRWWVYNRIVNLKNEYAGIQNLRHLEPLGIKDIKDYLPEIFIEEEYIKKAERFLKKKKIKRERLLIFFVSAKYISRKFPPDMFMKVIDILLKQKKYYILILFGYRDEETYRIFKEKYKNEERVYLTSTELSLKEMAGLMKVGRVVITSDTGPKHLAVAVGVPVITIFGATSEKTWNPPDRKKYPVIRAKIKCAPCNKNICPYGTYDCFYKIKPETIVKKIERIIKSS